MDLRQNALVVAFLTHGVGADTVVGSLVTLWPLWVADTAWRQHPTLHAPRHGVLDGCAFRCLFGLGPCPKMVMSSKAPSLAGGLDSELYGRTTRARRA